MKKRNIKHDHYKLYETGMKEQGTKGGTGPKELE